MVEFALVIPLLVALLAGIIDFGLAFNNLQTVRQEARDTTRLAAVATVNTPAGCSHGGGSVSATTQDIVCSVKTRLGDDAAVMIRLPDTDGYAVGNKIVVCVQKPYKSLTGLYAGLVGNSAAQVKVESRIEATADDAVEPLAEPAPAGQDWSFCS